jgi:hypothetical protein
LEEKVEKSKIKLKKAQESVANHPRRVREREEAIQEQQNLGFTSRVEKDRLLNYKRTLNEREWRLTEAEDELKAAEEELQSFQE